MPGMGAALVTRLPAGPAIRSGVAVAWISPRGPRASRRHWTTGPGSHSPTFGPSARRMRQKHDDTQTNQANYRERACAHDCLLFGMPHWSSLSHRPAPNPSARLSLHTRERRMTRATYPVRRCVVPVRVHSDHRSRGLPSAEAQGRVSHSSAIIPETGSPARARWAFPVKARRGSGGWRPSRDKLV